MTSRDFAYWLQGFFEISGAETMTKEQVESVKKHLNMVFIHEIDPSMGDQKMQDALNNAHKPSRPNNGSTNSTLVRC